MNYGERLEELLNQSGQTRKEVAAKMGIVEAYVSQLVNKIHLKTDIIEAFCKAVNIDVADFFVPEEELNRKIAEKLNKIDPDWLEIAQIASELPEPYRTRLIRRMKRELDHIYEED